jgi:hypothetical protein
MVRRRNLPQKAERRDAARQEGDERPEGAASEVVFPSAPNVPLINAEIVQILIQNNNPDEVRRLMDADLAYNKERLAIIREHADQHPQAKEDRKTISFRRTQYVIMLVVLVGLLAAMPFVSLAVAATFGILCILIVSGVLLNGREREFDLAGFVQLLGTIVRREQ